MRPTGKKMQLRQSLLAALLAAAAILGCMSAAQAQVVDREYRYDLVLLFPYGTQHPQVGAEVEVKNSDHVVVRDHARYFFSSALTKAAFEKDPERYLPGGHGWCLLDLYHRADDPAQTGEMLHPGDPRARSYVIGRWFFHRDLSARDEFEKDPRSIENRTIAALMWLTLKKRGLI